MNKFTPTTPETVREDAQSGDEPDVPTATPDWSRAAFERIRFENDPKGGSNASGLKMPGGYWVKESTIRAAFHLFWRSAHRLDPTRLHKTEDLACAPDWEARPRGQRIAMGRCFKYFATHGVLPLTLMNPEVKCNFKYRLNDGLTASPTIH